MWISLLGQFINLRASWIWQSHNSGYLVKGLPCCIISSLSHQAKGIIILYMHQRSMTTRNHQGHKWRLQILMADKIGKDMPLQMIYPNQRHIQSKGQSLGSRYSHQQGAYQARAIGNSYLVNISKLHASLGQSLINYRHNINNMLAGGNLRHDAPKFLMYRNLS